MASTDPFRKVHSGEPFHMSAAAYNAFVDAARAHAQQHLFGPPRRPESPLQGQVLVRNDTGEPRDRYSVLGIAGPLIDPSDNLPEFQRILGVRGVTPAAEHAGRFVILLEPLGAGSIGRACIDGVCPVEVEMAAETDGYPVPHMGMHSIWWGILSPSTQWSVTYTPFLTPAGHQEYSGGSENQDAANMVLPYRGPCCVASRGLWWIDPDYYDVSFDDSVYYPCGVHLL